VRAPLTMAMSPGFNMSPYLYGRVRWHEANL
jgi:hypothetical protein